MQTAIPPRFDDEQDVQTYLDETNGVEIIVYANYDLSGIPKEFKIADFERQVRQRHMLQIADAIISRTLYDSTITVVKPAKEGQPYEVIDGQHRLTAMQHLHKLGQLDKYTFVVRVLHAEDARLAYRRLNSGKPLNIFDLFKSYDDGTVPYFNMLRPYCAHYKSTHRIPYGTVAYAYMYGLRNEHIMNRESVMQAAVRMPVTHVEELQHFFAVIKRACGGEIEAKLALFRQTQLWSLVKLWFLKVTGQPSANAYDNFAAVVKAAMADPEIRKLTKQGRSFDSLKQTYERLSMMWDAQEAKQVSPKSL